MLIEINIPHFAVHPCDRGEWNGGCEQTCKKNNKEAYCECNDGFKLSKDGFKCDKCRFTSFIIPYGKKLVSVLSRSVNKHNTKLLARAIPENTNPSVN